MTIKLDSKRLKPSNDGAFQRLTRVDAVGVPRRIMRLLQRLKT